MFWAKLERFGESVALVDDTGRTVSYLTLAREADEAGFSGRPRVLVLMAIANDIPSLTAYLGCLRAGHAVILTDARRSEAFENLAARYRPNLIWTERQGVVERNDPLPVALHDDLAVLLISPGPTGDTELVRLSDEMVCADARRIRDQLRIDPSVRAITSMPAAASYGLSIIHAHLSAGASLVLTTGSVADPDVDRLMHRGRVTSMAGVPDTAARIEAAGLLESVPASMTSLTQAGGLMLPERIRVAAERRNIQVPVLRGLTGATAWRADRHPEQRATVQDAIAQAIPGCRFDVRDPECGEPAETAGERVYHGPDIPVGYAESPVGLADGHRPAARQTGDRADLSVPDIGRVGGRNSRLTELFGAPTSGSAVETERHGRSAVARRDDTRAVGAAEGPFDPATRPKAHAELFARLRHRLDALARPAPAHRTVGPVDAPASQMASPAKSGETVLEAYAALLARIAGKPSIGPHASFATVGGHPPTHAEASLLLGRLFGRAPANWERLTLRQLTERAASIAPPAARSIRPERLRYIESLRSIAILLVVAAHTSTAFLLVDPMAPNENPISFFSFRHVNAIFTFIAGFLFQYLLYKFVYRKYLTAKFTNVILPYVLISVPAIVAYLVGFKDTAALGAPAYVQGKLELVVYMLLTGTQLGPLWFIPMMALFYLLAPVFRTVDRSPALYWAIGPLLVGSYFVGRSIDDSNPAQSLFFYLPAYLAGMAACRYRSRLMPHVMRWWPLLVLAVFVPELIADESGTYEVLTLVAKIAFGLGMLGGLARVADRIPDRFNIVGELSFGIYFVHGYIIGVGLVLAKHNELAYAVFDSFVGAALVVVCLSLIAVLATKRILGRYSRMVIGA